MKDLLLSIFVLTFFFIVAMYGLYTNDLILGVMALLLVSLGSKVFKY